MRLRGVAEWERGRIVIEALLRNGINYFVYAVGAQSSPLVYALLTLREKFETSLKNTNDKHTLALIKNSLMLCSHVDERGASYHAVGYAKATGRGAAVILTSGTAVANVMPAVVEAYKSELPLLVLSADRPPELHNVRSNQTIPQDNFFGKFAVYSSVVPTLATPFDLKTLLKTIKVGCSYLTSPSTTDLPSGENADKPSSKGVVHFNVPFRKPLIGKWSAIFDEVITERTLLKTKTTALNRLTNEVSYDGDERRLSDFDEAWLLRVAKKLLALKKQGEKILLVSGALDGLAYTEQTKVGAFIKTISRYLELPIFMDIASPLSGGLGFDEREHAVDRHSVDRYSHNRIIENFPLILNTYVHKKDENICKQLHFKTIVHIGGEVVNDMFLSWLREFPPDDYIHLERIGAHYDPGCILPPYRKCHVSKVAGYLPSILEYLVLLLQPNYQVKRSVDQTAASTADETIKDSPLKVTDNRLASKKLAALNRNLRLWTRTYKFTAFSELDIVRTIMQSSLLLRSENKFDNNQPTKKQPGRQKVDVVDNKNHSKLAGNHLAKTTKSPQWSLFLGNSMPIRSFALLPMENGFKNIFTARGTSGIDGLLAIATGISQGTLVTMASSHVMVVLGDLSFLHDLNSLLLLTKNNDWVLGLIVINNHEGTIFNHLPIKPYLRSYWDEFIFKHTIDFKYIAKTFEIDYMCLADKEGVAAYLRSAFFRNKSFLLELSVESKDNFNEHNRFVTAARDYIAKEW
ncbi:2-succinyl-5-enolpyruvyl-6-hydroxy-3-cyclohexene-1-carboxylate synthase [Spirochaetota bacterium]|nr:2-succinyl-5-enolpyruvyl-6-hydroxy-3-cyclohexene-1-carboxylate synthase [Spirochaetota bacterium]